MKRLTIFSLTCLFSVGAVFAQQGVTQCGVPTGQPKFPLLTYQELPDPTAPSDKEWAAVTSTQVSWGTTDTRYAKHAVPVIQPQKSITLEGWRGEKLHAQAVVWTGTEVKDLNFSFTDFKDKKAVRKELLKNLPTNKVLYLLTASEQTFTLAFDVVKDLEKSGRLYDNSRYMGGKDDSDAGAENIKANIHKFWFMKIPRGSTVYDDGVNVGIGIGIGRRHRGGIGIGW